MVDARDNGLVMQVHGLHEQMPRGLAISDMILDFDYWILQLATFSCQ